MAEGQLGSLVVSLSADIARFSSDMGKAQKVSQDVAHRMAKDMSGVQASIDRMGTSITKTAGLLAGMAGIGSLGALVKGSIDAADNMSKMSQKVGVAIDQLSGMAYAASLADVSTEQLAKGMGKLAKTMYEASGDSNSSAAKTFQALGVSVTDAAGRLKDTDTVMMAVAERMAGMKDGAGKTALAMEVFGKSGADLIPLLNAGKQGLREAADEAKRFGMILTAEAGRQAEEFNDNLTRLKARASGVAITLANELLPEINSLVDKFAKGGDIANSPLMEGLRSVKAEFLRLAMLADKAGGSLTSAGMLLYGPGSAMGYKPSVERFENMAKWNIMFEERYKESEKAMQTMANLEVGLDANGNPFKPKNGLSVKPGNDAPFKLAAGTSASSASHMYTAEGDLLLKRILEAEKARAEEISDVYQLFLQDQAKTYQEASDVYQLFMQDMEKGYQKMSDIYQLALQDMEKMKKASEEMKEMQRFTQGVNAGIKNPDDPYAGLNEKYASDSEAINAKIDQYDIMSEADDAYTDHYNAAIDKRDAIDKKYAQDKSKLDKEMAMQALGSLGDSLGSLGQTLMQGNKEAFEAGKKMAIASATISMTLGAIQAYTSQVSIPYVGPALGAIAAAAVIAAGMSNIMRIESTTYEGREFGGPVRAGQSYIVGEKRPELFTPGASGMITPYVPKGGGGDVTLVNNFSTGVTDTVRAEMMRMIPAFNASALATIKRAQREGQLQ